jgi:hypothetical protein
MEGRPPEQVDPFEITQDAAAADRRAHPRYKLRIRLRVHDRLHPTIVGEVIDIGLGGLRLRVAEPIPPARRYRLSIEIGIGARDRPRIDVIARCVWHRATPDRLFEAGFEFVETTARTRLCVAKLIDEYGA